MGEQVTEFIAAFAIALIAREHILPCVRCEHEFDRVDVVSIARSGDVRIAWRRWSHP